MAHARTFHNQTVIKTSGYQFANVSKHLQLGDVIIKLPPETADYKFALDGVEAFVIITQACDIQQSNADAFLMLKGRVYRRDWTESLKPAPTRTDTFIWNEVQYSLDWERAHVATLKISAMGTRLKPGGTHARIARFRDVGALTLQNVFASNLTRVGAPVSFHHTKKVGIQLWAKGCTGQPQRVVLWSADEGVAALIDGRMLEPPQEGSERKSKFGHALVLDRMTPEKIAAALKAASFHGVAPQQVGQLQALSNSTEDLNRLRIEHRVPKAIVLSQSTKIDLLWKIPDDKWKGSLAIVIDVPLSTQLPTLD